MNFYKELLKEYLLQEEIETNGKNLNRYLEILYKKYNIINRYLKAKKYTTDFETYYDEFIEIKEKINSFNIDSLNQKDIQKDIEIRNEAKKLLMKFNEEIDFKRMNEVLNVLITKSEKTLEIETKEESKETLQKIIKTSKIVTRYIYNEINLIRKKYNDFFKTNIDKKKFKMLY